MTLTLTVTTPRCIYQSADYRLFDVRTGNVADFETQKIVLINTFRWTATVCFSGVGRTYNLDVGEWLAERVVAIRQDDPFERLLDELLTADVWLVGVPAPHNRHSFTVGAFVGSQPVFALVSNFEQPSGLVAETASTRLQVFQLRPAKPRTFVSGQRWAVTRSVRRRLAALAVRDPDPQTMYAALAEENRRVAMQTPKVSPACFTAHSRITGEGGGYAHDIGNRPFVPSFAFPSAAKETITRLLDEQFGPGKARLVQMATVRSEASDEYHNTQLREKPQDPSVHSNYGAYLKDKKEDLEGAEREYRRAIELDPKHANALGNLANLCWERGERDQASSLYRKALEADPGNENASWNYASFLLTQPEDRVTAGKVLDQAIAKYPDSGRLRLMRANLHLMNRAALEALEQYRQARRIGAEQSAVETGYAIALQLSGAPIEDCIGAYRVARSVNPKNAALKLNLAQLMFVKGYEAEANAQLREAMKLGLDESSQLEAQFYLLCHTSSAAADVFREMKSLLAGGARLNWDVQPNIEKVARTNPERAALVELVLRVIRGERNPITLDQVLKRWA
jgi:tetratricopeptide (TPR) repeat protein